LTKRISAIKTWEKISHEKIRNVFYALGIGFSGFVRTGLRGSEDRDDIRVLRRFFNLSYRLRLSAVMYDTAMRETIVLKGSTDTQDFWAGGVTEDGLSLNIAED